MTAHTVTEELRVWERRREKRQTATEMVNLRFFLTWNLAPFIKKHLFLLKMTLECGSNCSDTYEHTAYWLFSFYKKKNRGFTAWICGKTSERKKIRVASTVYPRVLITIFSTLQWNEGAIYHPTAIRELNIHMLTSPRMQAAKKGS